MELSGLKKNPWKGRSMLLRPGTRAQVAIDRIKILRPKIGLHPVQTARLEEMSCHIDGKNLIFKHFLHRLITCDKIESHVAFQEKYLPRGSAAKK